ncbi:family 20 glycosylhydrolase [Sulfuriroseicoccus oceanibius]|uniref:beta-N-acetylhexosaminidase n=1 Tax=Sulfuriroseicoccus oceanibius TaxID=2707525 RepID=A0A6B3LCC2_9BACT|nr:family 20 glycosylhydrolase [Sulfuriroseicoccus oceanibius]QQL45313.1 beta-N-acetylhexosaminidase [Sulfuriroseicoccus oceanibius]
MTYFPETCWCPRVRALLRLTVLSALALALSFAGVSRVSASDEGVSRDAPALLPMPRQVEWGRRAVSVDRVKVVFPEQVGDALKFARLKDEVAELLERNGVEASEDAEQLLMFRFGNVAVPNQWRGQSREAYRLVVEDRGVSITANDVAGMYYGLQTLRQLMVNREGQTTVAACKVYDYPAFKIRGFMHDVGRNFQSLEQLKMQIDTFAAYKINTFHFHVTEYHGWRLESKIYPELQRIDTFTRKPGKYYTQQEFKDLVDYCWARNITVIPEFDTPGHSDAFRKALGIKTMKDPKAKEAMVRLFDELCSLVPKEKMPYIHVGTDEASKPEERVNADYLPALHEVIQRNGRDVIGWVHGMHIKGDTKQIQQTWASSKPLPKLRHIDSRANYLNYLQALNFATRVHFQQPCSVPHGDETNLGGILCYWPDTKVDDEKQALLNSPVLSAVVGYSEAVWRGVPKDQPEYWCKIPPRGTSEFKRYAHFEERLIEQRERFQKGKPFLALRTHNVDWRLLGPVADGEVEALERGEIRDRYDGYAWSAPVQGAALHLRHFFKFPSHLKSFPKGKDVVWANTFVFSPVDQEVDAWIGFNTVAASGYKGKETIPAQGDWDGNPACNIWINGERVDPPVWESTAQGMEHALTNEIYSARPPTKIRLKKGWNPVLVKAARSYKWCFAFKPIHVDAAGNITEVDGLKFSSSPSR